MTLPIKPNSPLSPHLQHSDQTTHHHDLHTSSTVPSDDTPRERLKRHRVAVAGHVWIPDKWGKEEFLKDWIDGSAFEASLFPSGIMLARQALAREAKRSSPNNNAATTTTTTTAPAAASGDLRLLNGC
ncbi:Protein BIC1, partial [Cucurbita argyrosperma subsp. sororia]